MPSLLLSRNFASGHTYHLRHQAKKGTTLFLDQADYKSFVITLSYYLRFPTGTPLSWVPRLNAKTLAAKQTESRKGSPLPCTLHSFLLLPDHFHLVLTENVGSGKAGLPAGKAGISELMRRLSVGYAMTYRKKHGGQGTIYQGKYKMIDCTKEAGSLVNWLHSHQDTNPTYLRDLSHSSLSDYELAPRPWLSPLPLTGQPCSQSLTLEKHT